MPCTVTSRGEGVRFPRPGAGRRWPSFPRAVPRRRGVAPGLRCVAFQDVGDFLGDFFLLFAAEAAGKFDADYRHECSSCVARRGCQVWGITIRGLCIAGKLARLAAHSPAARPAGVARLPSRARERRLGNPSRTRVSAACARLAPAIVSLAYTQHCLEWRMCEQEGTL